MKRILVLAVAALGLSITTTSEAGIFCSDACSGQPGESCNDINLGCEPTTGQCISCTSDLQCAPGGTCIIGTGACNVNCNATPDAGPGDSGPGEAGPGDTGPADTGPNDSGMTDAVPTDGAPDQGVSPQDMGAPGDSGPIDMAVVIPDQGIREVGTPGGGGKNMLDPNRMQDEDCSCSSTSSRGGGLVWFVFLALGFVRRRQV